MRPEQIESAVANNNIWLFSQRKSGTTLLCHALAFYNAAIHQIEGVDFDTISLGGVARRIGRVEKVLRDIQGYQKQTNQPPIIHTHEFLYNCNPTALILTTRNPFDFAVSAYHFFMPAGT